MPMKQCAICLKRKRNKGLCRRLGHHKHKVAKAAIHGRLHGAADLKAVGYQYIVHQKITKVGSWEALVALMIVAIDAVKIAGQVRIKPNRLKSKWRFSS